jgi:hypothetical protein
VAMLDKLTRKLSQPVAASSPDAQQNQTESKPAIEAEVVEVVASSPVSLDQGQS